MTIPILSKDFYTGFVSLAPDGKSAFTHLAFVRLPDGRKVRAYLKLYKKDTSKELLNEITGYLLAKSAGIPQPPTAFIIDVPIEVLKKAHPEFQPSPGEKTRLLWGTEEVVGKSLKLHFGNTKSAALRKEIRRWSYLPHTVAFDDWTANTDRNTGNIIRKGKHNLAIIDNGYIATGPDWNVNSLIYDAIYDNKLIMIAYNGKPTLKQKNQVINEYDKFKGVLNSTIPELTYWWSLLLQRHEAEALHSFIESRAEKTSRLRDYWGVI